MKNPEEAIERVLAGLREAEAPAGMEARILRAAEARAVETALRGWWRLSMGRYLAGGALAAGLVVLALSFMTSRSTDHRAKDGRSVPIAATSRGVAIADKVAPQRLKPHGDGIYGTAEAVPSSRTGDASSEVEGHVDYDSLAVSEMLAPSRPAPPLPPTQQETLLAQVVHKGDPEQIDDLKAEVRAKQIEVAKAEFHDFFEPPAVKDNE